MSGPEGGGEGRAGGLRAGVRGFVLPGAGRGGLAVQADGASRREAARVARLPAAQVRVARAVISMSKWRPANPLALVRPCAYRSTRVVARICRTSSLAAASVVVRCAAGLAPRAGIRP